MEEKTINLGGCMKKTVLVLMAAMLMAATSVWAAEQPSKTPSTKTETTTTETKASAKSDVKIVYRCPMHTDVTAEKPGKCPKCNMALEEFPQTGRGASK